MTTGDAPPTVFPVQAVQRPRQQVEEQIRSAIRSGVLKTGQKLPTEVALSRDFGVSRTTVREALRSLVADGLIEKLPGAGGGSFVRALDHESFGVDLGHDIENLLRVGSVDYSEATDVRRMVEVPCAMLAAVNASDADVEELSEVVALRKKLPFDDPAVPELDARFHSLIGRTSGNRIAEAFIVALHHATHAVPHLEPEEQVGKRTVRQHHAIVLAIDAGDPDGAEAAMLEHLAYLEQQAQT